MLVFSKDNTLATFQYHAYILCYMHSETEIQVAPCETDKHMKYSKSGFGRKASVWPIPFITVKQKCIFPSIQNKMFFIPQLNRALRRPSSIDPVGLSITRYSESYVRKGILFNEQSQGFGNWATWIILGKKYIKLINWLMLVWNCYLLSNHGSCPPPTPSGSLTFPQAPQAHATVSGE